MLIGYQRTSTLDQNLDLQRDALKQAGCERIFSDQVSGAKFDRPGLNEALKFTREGDCICVWRLDRLGRSLQHLIEVVADLESRGGALKSLTENIDTLSAGGRLVFHVFAAMAEFERNLTRERCLAGLAAARARGRTGGRRQVLTGPKLELAKKLRADRTMPADEACQILGCSRSTFYKATG
ncbi:MAG: recombinase family protein [Fimbriimonadaceae bacterium]|nr:recombinase family protein [Fimbriimonadaceae bacterium]